MVPKLAKASLHTAPSCRVCRNNNHKTASHGKPSERWRPDVSHPFCTYPSAKAGNRDALPALVHGKAMWPSLREAIDDGAFTAERCRTWSNWHGMRHRVVERDPATKGFVVVARRWVVERSFGWLAHWNGLARDRAGRLDVSAGRLARVAVLSGVEALINPMPIHQMAA